MFIHKNLDAKVNELRIDLSMFHSRVGKTYKINIYVFANVTCIRNMWKMDIDNLKTQRTYKLVTVLKK